ncbi:MAG: type II secretion system protein, partial [Ruminococcus sp.]|nr:type II secretion system protein [Ruminococcus sp.]
MKKRFSEKGFTLVEMVVVIAIIGVLAAIIVPSIINYVRKARLKADVTTGRMIAEEVIALITDDSRLRASLFLMTDKNNGFVETSNIRGSKTDMTVQCEGEAPYCIRAVLKMNGHRGTSGEKNDKWTGVDETAPLANALFDDDAIISGDKTYAIPMRSTDYNGMVLNRWYICHR